MDSSRQRVIAPETGIWTPQRATRRRSRLGPPLCSTTFGGHTVPPLFGGGGSAPATAIFLRSTSAFFNKDVDGNLFNISAPARSANDSMFCLKAGFGQNLAAPAGWTAEPAFANGNLQLYTRLATNTAADDFFVDDLANTRNVVAQVGVFGNTLSQITLLTNYQSGILNNNTGSAGDTTWNMNLMFADATPPANNLVLAIYMRERNFGVNGAATTLTQPAVLTNTIGGIAYNMVAAPVSRLFCGWEWQDEVGVNPLIPAANITYTPLEDFSVETLQMQRFEY